MAGEHTTTTFDAALTVAVNRRMLPFAVRQSVVFPLFNFDDDSEGHESKISRWPDNSGDITDPVAETADVGLSTTNVTSATLTPDVTGIAFDVGDLLASSTPLAGLQNFVEEGSGILVEQAEDDVHALFGSFSTSRGATTVDLTLATFLTAAVDLKMNQAPFPIFAILAPIAVADLAVDMGGLGGISEGTSVGLVDVAGGDVGLKGVVGSIPVYESARAVSINTNADRESWMGHRDAITIRRKWMLRPEFERDARGVSTNVVVTNAYGLVESADEFGVQLVSDHET